MEDHATLTAGKATSEIAKDNISSIAIAAVVLWFVIFYSP
jgi:hypothetical protein